MSELDKLIAEIEPVIQKEGYDWLVRSNMRPDGRPNGYFANITHPDARIGSSIPCRHTASTMEHALRGSFLSWQACMVAAKGANEERNSE